MAASDTSNKPLDLTHASGDVAPPMMKADVYNGAIPTYRPFERSGTELGAESKSSPEMQHDAPAPAPSKGAIQGGV